MKLIKAWTGDLDRAYELFGKFQADEHGFISDAYLSVNKDNPASLAVQRHLGARIDHDNDTEYFTRIRIAEPDAMPEPCRDPGKDGVCG